MTWSLRHDCLLGSDFSILMREIKVYLRRYLLHLLAVLNLVCKIETVGIFVCLFAYSSWRDKPICNKLGMLPWVQEENKGRSQLRKTVLSSIFGEDCFCSSETKHDKRMAPRPNLIVSNRKEQKKGSKRWENDMDSSPGEDGFCKLSAKHDKRTAPGTTLYVSKRFQKQGQPPPPPPPPPGK
jgi:hypothetical protein